MPLTTPFLPLTVSAASLSSSNSSYTGEPQETGLDSDEPQLRFDLEALSAVSEASATSKSASSTAPPTLSARSNSRRLTFTRFPLLRKGSRELTRATSVHSRGSSISAAVPPSRADSPFLSTGVLRASRTSFARGRTEQPNLDPSSAREPSAHASLRSGSIEGEEPENTQSLTSLQQAANAGKMHQTSSRLLRMTDDERPYTRVSALVSPAPSSTIKQTSVGRLLDTSFGFWPSVIRQPQDGVLQPLAIATATPVTMPEVCVVVAATKTNVCCTTITNIFLASLAHHVKPMNFSHLLTFTLTSLRLQTSLDYC